jgi:hypothetical protein
MDVAWTYCFTIFTWILLEFLGIVLNCVIFDILAIINPILANINMIKSLNIYWY